MDRIKPVAWAFKQDWPRFQEDNQECRLLPNFYWGSDLGENSYYEPLYDQSAIDALRAEVDRLHGLLNSAPVVRIGGADGLSCFIEKFGKSSLPSMQGQSVALVSVGAMKDSAP